MNAFFYRYILHPLPALLSILLVFSTLKGVSAQEGSIPLEVIKTITLDDSGVPLRFPSSVFFDRNHEEIYFINGNKGRVLVYGPGPAYLPLLSLGTGRGVDSPNGISVDGSGLLYVCQLAATGKPSRLTIFNGALFIEKEISFADVPGLEDFAAYRAVKGATGLIYVASRGGNGVVVLDGAGKYLRMLVPVVEKYSGNLLGTVDRLQDLSAFTNQANLASGGDQDAKGVGNILADMPPELRPRARVGVNKKRAEVAEPLKVRDLIKDSKGNLYLTSEEKGKVYVYSPEEKFLFAFGEKGGAPRKLSRAQGVAVDEKKQWAYVVDYMRHTVLVYDLKEKGRYLFEFGGRGPSPGWFNYPSSIAVTNEGYVIVGDYFNQRVQILNVKVDAQRVGSTIKEEVKEQ